MCVTLLRFESDIVRRHFPLSLFVVQLTQLVSYAYIAVFRMDWEAQVVRSRRLLQSISLSKLDEAELGDSSAVLDDGNEDKELVSSV